MSQYIDDFGVTLSTINANLAHTCGNVSSVMFENFKSKFPKKFFKYEHVNTRIAVKQFQNIKHIVDLKQQKPMVAMQPRLILDPTEANIEIMRRMYGTNIYDLLRPDYHNVKFFKDTTRGIYVDFSVERMKMSFEFSILVSTEFQQYNVASHMKNAFRVEHPEYLPTTLETVIPECIIKQILHDTHVEYYDDDGKFKIKEFLEYMNTISNIPVTYNYQPSTGIYRFFLVTQQNIFAQYSSLNMSDGDRDGQQSDSFPISIQLDIEFNYPNCFFYLNREPSQDYIDTDEDSGVIASNGEVELYYTMQRTIIPQFDKDFNELYVSFAFSVDDPNAKEPEIPEENPDEGIEPHSEEDVPVDRIPIDSLFDPDRTELINSLIDDEELTPDDYIKMVVYKNGYVLDSDKYYIDWVKMELVIKEPDPKYTYRLACYESNKIKNSFVLSKHTYK